MSDIIHVYGTEIVIKECVEDGVTFAKAWVKGDEDGANWTALKMRENDWIGTAYGIEREGSSAEEALRELIKETL